MAIEEANVQATLHDEALEELGLSEQPFIDDKKRSRFSDSTSQKVRATLEQHLRFGESLHLFLGDHGAGKTVFLSQLIKHCKSSIKPFVAKGQENFETVAFLAAVLNQLGGDEAESVSDHVDALVPLFEKLADEQMSVVLAIDDAHLAPIEEIAELIDIMPAFVSDDTKNARLLLTGEPRLNDELAAIADEFDGLTLEHAVTMLQPMDESRIRDYITSRLNQAGHTDVFPFTDKAITKIQRESRGLPANVNILASKYLNTVYAGGAAVGGKGFLTALGWPLVAMGAAAVGLIAWGLSMFFGNSGPASPVVETTSPVARQESVATDNIADADSKLMEEESDTGIIADNTASITPVTPSDATETAKTGSEVAAVEDDGLLMPKDRANADGEFDTSSAIAAALDQNSSSLETDSATAAGTSTSESVAAVTKAIDSTTIPIATTETQTQTQTQTDDSANQTDTNQVEPESTPAVEIPIVADADAVNDDTGSEQVPGSVTVPITNPFADNQEPVVPDATPDPVNVIVAQEASETPETNENGVVVQVEPLAAANTSQTSVPTTSSPTAVPAGGTSESVVVNTGEAVTLPQTVINRAVENERWVLFQEPTSFTVQLATSRERDYIIDLAQSLAAEDPVAIYPFLTTNSNNPVFGLLSGLYKTRTQAIEAVEQMDPATKQFGVWIRPISDLQADIKKQP